MRVRNDTSGDIPKANTYKSSLILGVSYDLPLNKKYSLFLTPDISYSFGLTPVINNYLWCVNILRIRTCTEISRSNILPDTIYNTYLSIKAVCLDSISTGTSINGNFIREKFVLRQIHKRIIGPL